MADKLCPNCKSLMTLRSGKFGSFWGCSAYPRCKTTLKIEGSRGSTPFQKKEITKVPYKPLPLSAEQHDIKNAFAQTCKALLNRFHRTAASMYPAQIHFANHAEPFSIMVPSVPGSGKTAMLVELSTIIPSNLRALFACFNTNIRDTLLARIPDARHTILSVNQLGFRACGNTWKSKFNKYKLHDITKALCAGVPEDEQYAGHLLGAARKATEMLKVNLLDPTTENVEEVACRYNLEISANDFNDFIAVTQQVYAASLATGEVDYTDQYALAVIKNATPAERFHIILGDEVQDWSKAQIECVKRHLIPGGIFVLVGDPDQSIYSWRGADPDGMEKMQADTQAELMRMTVSFRCPHNAINFAKRLVPHIQAAPNAKAGTTIDASSEDVLAILKEKKRALLISRKNLPLAKWALLLLRNGVPAIIRGRDILGNLLSYVDRFADAPDLTTFITDLKTWTDAELAKLGAMGNKGEAKAEALQDQTGTVIVLCEGLNSVAELRKRLDTIFDDEAKDKVICSTVYRAKGDEHETIVIVGATDFDKVWGTNETAIKERRNAAFVLITRTLDTIIFCDGRPGDFTSDGSAHDDDCDNDNDEVTSIADPEPEPIPEPVKAKKPRKRKAV